MDKGEPSATLSIALFGSFDVRLGDRPLPRFRSRKSQWLLALLALQNGRAVSRAWLAGMLWPDSTGRQAAYNLSRNLTDLRHSLGPEARRLDAPTGQTLRLDLVGAEADLLVFDEAISRGDPFTDVAGAARLRSTTLPDARGVTVSMSRLKALETAVALHRGPLLQDCLEDWVLPERALREQAFLAALERLAEQALLRGEPEEAVRCLRRLVAADPLRDSAHRALMQALAATGDLGAVTQLYRDFRLRLHHELNAAPDPETTALYERLRRIWRRQAPCNVQRATCNVQRDDHRTLHAARCTLHGSEATLPRPLTRLVGREEQLRAVGARLEEAPLVTLTGPGGIGKTRLAIQVAEERRDEFADGARFVDLSGLRDEGLVPAAVAAALGVDEAPSRSVTEALAEFLAPRHLLLILDNCEHLTLACALLSEGLLQAAPRLRILATSRQPLGISGETVWPVPPLSLPDEALRAPGSTLRVAGPHTERGARSPERLSAFEAVRLFVERAGDAAPAFALTEENAEVVARLCRRLDGIPLAIELAAARLRALTVEQIATRLDDSLRLLTLGSRTAPARHQTLRGTMDWSYALLTEPKRMLLRRLAVFAGGFTLEAAEAIGGKALLGVGCSLLVNDDSTGPEPTTNNQQPTTPLQVIDLLGQLVDKSLVVMERQDGEARYRLLETVRQYAGEKLVEAGEAQEVRRRHRDWYLQLAEEAEPELQQREQTRWLERLTVEHDNLRLALEWSLSQGEDEEALRLVGALGRAFYMRGRVHEGCAWMESALSRGPQSPTAARAKALHGAAVLWHERDAYTKARELEEASLAIRRRLGDRRAIAESLDQLGHIVNAQGDYARATALFEESLALRRELGDRVGAAASLNALGYMARLAGDYDRAAALSGESLQLRRELEDPWGVAYSLEFLCQVAVEQGDTDRAAALCEETLALRRQLGDRRGIAAALINAGHIAAGRGEWEAARGHYAEGLRLWEELGNLDRAAGCLAGMASVALARGDAEEAEQLYRHSLKLWRETGQKPGMARGIEGLARAAVAGDATTARWSAAVRLLGAADAAREAIGVPLPLTRRQAHEQILAAARERLGDAAFAAAWSEGRALPLEQAVAEALG